MKREKIQRNPKISGNKILIVAEGKNTEPIYFTELYRFYAKIKGRIGIISQGNPNILEMIETARRQLKDSGLNKGLMSPLKYEKAYIVIDRDHFANEPEGIRRLSEAIKSIGANENIEVVLSSPCFEFWFFLHFLKERPMNTNVILSKLEDELRRANIIPANSHYPKERKEATQFIQRLVRMNRLGVACENSVWVDKQTMEADIWNKHPHTNVQNIINALGIWNELYNP